MRPSAITHQFVEHVPRELQDGVLYISLRYRTAVHRCACGCGNKVVTPIRPSDWTLTFDGDSVSLSPSIGNWQFQCRSHYWVKQNTIQWSGRWTDAQIAAGWARDQRDREMYLAAKTDSSPMKNVADVDGAGRLPRVWRLWRSLRSWRRGR